jgi:phosphoglycerate dehydrogenase-like enzyme
MRHPAEEQLRRILFTTSADVHGGLLAEFAVFGVLAGANDLPRLLAQQRDRNWTGLPGTAATEKLIGTDVLAAVKPGTILVNVGRGTVVDEDSLLRALRDGRIGFAALNVLATEPLLEDSPLWSEPNVLVSPHTAALNAAEDRLIAELFAANASRFLDGDELTNRVDTNDFY